MGGSTLIQINVRYTQMPVTYFSARGFKQPMQLAMSCVDGGLEAADVITSALCDLLGRPSLGRAT